MKAAVLCNGPSRTAFFGNESAYDFTMGCNIPWTKVDATVVLDDGVVDKWASVPNLISVPTYFSINAWRRTDAIKKRDFFKQFLTGDLIKPKYPYHSCGHNAVETVIRLGYNIIDVYGCDSYFRNDTSTFTRSIITEDNTADDAKLIAGWRMRWKEIVHNHPEVTLNFIGSHEDIHQARLP